MNKPDFSKLKALYINCTLKRSPEKSHTKVLMDVSANIMKKEGVDVEHIRFIDHDVATGVQPDMTEHGWDTDAWNDIYKKVDAADILIIGTPIWLGEKSSQAQLLIERLYSMSGLTNDKGQYKFYGKVGGTIITGNEDGIKHCAMGILYSMQHVGYSIPPQADAGWIGEAGPGPSYGDDGKVGLDNDFTKRNTTFMTYNLMHLAKMLKENGGYSTYGNSKEEWNNGNKWAFNNPEYR
ncbi:multimeric flavodoxin WrbA [Nonlabens xylanidelens]|uniref:Multimeric flavodoxin WrbA n=1 Tax=Nonlabens xylanidelens TaxID=191564 RepID=A0A2S6IKX7_9FLAO|nr:flavodoxin family protein [Nonlabens xylanidelens]PPK94826.1 multimeric flavodoxin WrbA [Nonlabens xylanidelens]PQJ17382.1 flavodoxin [Nonlabens xylanidelens]